MARWTAVLGLLFFTTVVFSNPDFLQLGTCDLSAGMADSYVLAMSSQPGFCQTHGYENGKPECLHLTKDSYEAKHLVLHGLWPNQIACGQHYGFCGVEPKNSHCDYLPVELSTAVANALKKMMPSFHYGSCLERHEWNKHGSCQGLSSDEYFTIAMKLTEEINQSSFGAFLRGHTGTSVRLTELREALVDAYGASNSGKFYLGCKNGILVDVFVSLPAYINPAMTFIDLIQDAKDYDLYDSCPRNVKISNFYNKSLSYYDADVLHKDQSSSNVE